MTDPLPLVPPSPRDDADSLLDGIDRDEQALAILLAKPVLVQKLDDAVSYMMPEIEMALNAGAALGSAELVAQFGPLGGLGGVGLALLKNRIAAYLRGKFPPKT